MFEALKVRRGGAPDVSDEEMDIGMNMLMDAVKNDPNVRLN